MFGLSLVVPPRSLRLAYVMASVGQAAALTNYHSFVIPRNASYIYLMVIGGGGGGGGGLTGSAGTARGGGGGGASGLLVKGIFLADQLPRVLVLEPGKGGAAGAVGGAGGAGGTSFVATVGRTGSLVTMIQANGGGGGAAGTSAGTNAGGLSPNAETERYYKAGGLYVLGAAGVGGGPAGSLGSPGQSQTIDTSIVAGGTGGGSVNTNNTDVAGGALTDASGLFVPINGGVAGGGNGQAGAFSWMPFKATGGTGGGTAGASGSAGAGGQGGPGSGGGGGGGGVTGGAGGAGGPGIIFYGWW